MENTTYTLENLQAIFDAMQVIKDKDRSDYFRNYYIEVINRFFEIQQLEKFEKESNKKKNEKILI